MKQISAKYIVDEPNTILKYLLSNVKNKSKNNIKSLLTNECVFVNDKLVTKYDYSLKSNDVIDIKLSQIGNIKDKNKLDILYEDKYLLIVNKPANMLTIGTDKEKNNTLYHYTSNYVKNTNKNNKIFIVNRLDKETSGIVVFAKNENIKRAMQDNWNDIVSLRKYIAITHGITDDKGIIKSYLKENSSHMVYSTNDKNNGKLSITEYKKIKNNKKYSLLEIIIHTGRKNQIRVHMKDINHPIIGDNKYGIKDNFKRMMLHAYQIKFTHPITNKEVNIISRVDQVFDKVI
ncbi:pseudouridine synthase [Clostridium sp. CAG:1193]|nr:pseudouridine synthase [Clostridium sp. CAG:1193]